MYFCAICSESNRFAAQLRVLSRKFKKSLDVVIFCISLIIAMLLISFTIQPLFCGMTISGKPPVSNAKTGVPQLKDSATVFGRLSMGAR